MSRQSELLEMNQPKVYKEVLMKGFKAGINDAEEIVMELSDLDPYMADRIIQRLDELIEEDNT